MRCAVCGTDNPAGNKFCNSCGSELASAGTGAALRCEQCNAPLTSGLRFCPACGAAVVTGASTTPVDSTKGSLASSPAQPSATMALIWLGFALVIYFIVYKDITNVLIFAAVGGAMFFFRQKIAPYFTKALFFLPEKWRTPVILFLPFAIYYWILVQDELTIIVAGGLMALVIQFQVQIDKLLSPLWPLQERIPQILRIGLGVAIPIVISYSLAESGEYNGRESLLAITSMIINVPLVYILLHAPSQPAPSDTESAQVT